MIVSLPASKRFVNSFFRLTRVWNLVIVGLAQYFTAGFLIGINTLNDLKLFLLSLSTIAIAAAGYIINDYYDVKIDFINKPDRVVVGKSITRRFALLFHIVLSFVGIAIGFMLSWQIAAINVFSVFLLWLYSNNLKRLPFIGNLAVSLLTALCILVVDVLYPSHYLLIWIYAAFAFFMTLVREIVKDMEDLKGDNTFGCKTLPIIWGIRKTKILIYGILIIFIAIVLLLNDKYSQLPIHYFILFLFIPITLLIAWLIRADTTKHFAWLSTFCKIILLLGIMSMAFI